MLGGLYPQNEDRSIRVLKKCFEVGIDGNSSGLKSSDRESC